MSFKKTSLAMYLGKIMTTSLHKVFVYGTLKRGEPNHHWFSKEEKGHYKFLHQAQTIDKFPLIIATKYNIPFLLYSPGEGHFVKGEVYEVNDVVLKNLDILEDHPNYYVREKYKLKPLIEEESSDTSEQEILAWVYFIKKFRPELLKLRTFDNYTSNGKHGLKYVTSEESTIEDLSIYTDICL